MNKEIQKVENSAPNNTKTPVVGNEIFDSSFLNKRLALCCISSAVIAIVSVFIMLKMGLSSHDQHIEKLYEDFSSIDSRMKAISDSVTDLNAVIDSMKADWRNEKENSSYIYKSLSSLQNDIANLKKHLHIEDAEASSEVLPPLSSEKSSFIKSFENLVKNGAPFDGFLESYSEKIDMKKYQTADNVLKFASGNIKPVSDLKNDSLAVGFVLFQTKVSESFWEKQKRLIKEKFSDIIKINKTDEKARVNHIENYNDKQKFEKACELISDDKLPDALTFLENMKIENEDLSKLISDIRKRVDLENSFAEFKKEFIEKESVSSN